MKKFLLLLLSIIIPEVLFSQNIVSLNLRDIDFSEFQLIKMYLSVLDTNGKPITNIDSSMFAVLENQTGEKIFPSVNNFYKSDDGIALCFLIDASNSMSGVPLDNVKEGMLHILSELRPQDKMSIAMFNDKFYKKTGFETDRDILKNNINDLETGGSSTELYMSVIEAVKWLQNSELPKRRILVIISDGDDNSSTNKIEDCIKEVKSSGITVFSIGSIKETPYNKNTLQNIEKIANTNSGGKYYKIKVPEDMKNIIPLIYERIKEEYIIKYFSHFEVNKEITGQVQVKLGKDTYASDFKYESPKKIIKNAPAISFWKTKEFLYGSIGSGVILIVLLVFLFINVNKKKKYKFEKEQERILREKEAKENKKHFDIMQQDYDSLLDQLENASEISDSDKNKISELEKQLNEAAKLIPGTSPKIDTRRRTMIIESKGNNTVNIGNNTVNIPNMTNYATLTVMSGHNTGKSVGINRGEITIGRTVGELIINDDTVSRRHAGVYFIEGTYIVRDLGSTNGTFINGQRISHSKINSGDILKVGSVDILFKI
ncbi:MAG TPA: VWA domain-containing protein [Ignavibacteria bacterium]